MNLPDYPRNQSRLDSLRYRDVVAHRLAAALKRHGVNRIFGQSLPSMVHLAAESLGIRQVAYRNENTGGYMADGYARTTGKVAVVTAQNGPAATLLVAPLGEALKASIPIVALVQDVNRDATDRNAFQDFDHITMFESCAKWVRRVTEASRVEDYIDMAFVQAASGRPGPVVLMLPADLLLDQPMDGLAARKQDCGHYPLDRTRPSDAAIVEAAALLAGAKAPLVIAGGGVHSSSACAALAALQETAFLPVATTSMGKGSVSEEHPLSVGPVGYYMGANGAAHFLRPMVTEADVILLVGNRTNQNGTDAWTLYPTAATYIHIDIDGTEVGRNYEALRLVGDARETLSALTAALSREDLAKRKAARPALEAQIAEGRRLHFEQVKPWIESDQQPIRPERIMAEIDRRLTPETIVVADASYSSIWVANYMRARRAGQRFLSPRGLAGLGWGLPMALGAKVGNPEAPIICVAGDGGFAHAWAELETAKRMGLAVVLVILNNQILGFQKHAEDMKFGTHTDACDFEPVDHAAIARACGLTGIRVSDPAELGPALDRALSAGETVLIDVLSDPDAMPPITLFEVAENAG